MIVRLERETCSWKLTDLLTGESALFQADWDFPMLCSSLGHDVTCCGHTDGTVNCPVHGTTASEMITAASGWLWEHNGDEFPYFDNPGYNFIGEGESE